MKKITILSTSLLFLFSCSNPETKTSDTDPETDSLDAVAPKITATAETQAVVAGVDEDAADDPAFWYNEEQPENSLIIVTNKKKGLQVYNLNGKEVLSYPVGPVNNVDVRQGMSDSIDIVGASNRTNIAMDFWIVQKDSLNLKYVGSITSGLDDVYGFCLSKDKETNEVCAFVNSKTGKVEQWKLQWNGQIISGALVRTLQLQSQVEGMVADDELGKLYVGVEEGGVYKFDLAADGSSEGYLIEYSNESNPEIKYDVEGLTIYEMDAGQGYLIASSQGNNTYAVFERGGDNTYIGSFKISDGAIDGVQETDGIHVVSKPLGVTYPKGLFLCQDGFNYDGETKVSQNFKYVSWEKIADKLGLE